MPEPMSEKRLEELKELCEELEPGPWYSHEGDITAGELIHGVGCKTIGRFCVGHDDNFFSSDDVRHGHFVAESRTAFPELIAEVERLKRIVWLEPRNIPHCRFCGHQWREGHRCGSVYAEGGFDPSFGGVM